jgi:glycosyltransferase involved in cell wall biosynthesis
MSEEHPYRATIPAVADGLSRPLWSVIIPTYNSARYLRESLASVLAQDLGPDIMQIEVVDDHSTQDDPAAVVEELGRGRVGFYRQRENVGQVRNYETCLKRSRGKLIHMLQDDDYVRDGFYRKMQRAFDDNPNIGMAFCRNIYMDPEGHWLKISDLERRESGILVDWLQRIASGQRIGNPAVVVRREVYEKLGGFDRRLAGGEDWEMWVRIAAHYPVWFEVEPLTAYRVKRPGSVTEGSVRTGKVVRAMYRATKVIESYLPEHLPRKTVKEVSKQARSLYMRWAIISILQTLEAGDPIGTFTYMWLAIKCSYSGDYGLAFPVTFKFIRSKVKIRLQDGSGNSEPGN